MRYVSNWMGKCMIEWDELVSELKNKLIDLADSLQAGFYHYFILFIIIILSFKGKEVTRKQFASLQQQRSHCVVKRVMRAFIYY